MPCEKDPDVPFLGELIHFFDVDKCRHAGFVAYVYQKTNSKRPRINLSFLQFRGKITPATRVEPAEFLPDGTLIMINKWAFPGEISDDFCNVATYADHWHHILESDARLQLT